MNILMLYLQVLSCTHRRRCNSVFATFTFVFNAQILHNSRTKKMGMLLCLQVESSGPHPAVMQSSIDQGPYLNVADGMVAAMGDERIDSTINEIIPEENKHHNDQTNQIVSATENHGFANPNSKRRSGIVERCLNQISRQSNKSIWLLAYIAIVSTWPIVSAALGFLFKRKLDRGRAPK